MNATEGKLQLDLSTQHYASFGTEGKNLVPHFLSLNPVFHTSQHLLNQIIVYLLVFIQQPLVFGPSCMMQISVK